MALLPNLMKRMGMLGNADAFSNQLVPPAANPSSMTALSSEFTSQGQIENADVWGKYSARMQRPATYDQMVQLWDEMSNWDMLAAALSEIVEETLGKDEMSPATLWYECSDSAVEKELNEGLLETINAESNLPSQVWYLTGFGNAMEKLEYAKGEGVTGSSFYHPMDVRRFWLKRNRACAGFTIAGEKPNNDAAFSYPDGAVIERPSISGADQKKIELFYPWDVLHFRRLYRMRMTEHGEPLFDDAQQIYKKLRMAVDQMCVHRAQMQPDRYVINIDVQNLPPADQMAAVQRWKQSLRSKLVFGGQNGSEVADSFKSFYNPWALDTVLFMAKPAGFNHSIDKLNGTAQVPDVYDIELLQNMFFSIIGMPKWWITGQQGQQAAPSGKALLASDIRFLRKVKSIRRPLKDGYTWLAYFHCLLKGHKVENLNIEAKMPAIGSLEDQAKMEIMGAQSDVLVKYGEMLNSFGVPRNAWAKLIMERYLNLPVDVVNAFLVGLPNEQMAENLEGKGLTKSKMISELDRLLPAGHPDIIKAKKTIHDALNGQLKTENTTKYKSANAILGVRSKRQTTDGKASLVESGDVIIATQQNAENIVTESAPVKKAIEEGQTARPGYWKYGPPKQ